MFKSESLNEHFQEGQEAALFLAEYYSYGREHTRFHQDPFFSQAILNLQQSGAEGREGWKQKQSDRAIGVYSTIINCLVDQRSHFTVVVIPHEDPERYEDTGIVRLGRNIARSSDTILDGTGCLVRKGFFEEGGYSPTDVAYHASIGVSLDYEKRQLIQDKQILLIGDVSGRGERMEACARLLKEAGAAQVVSMSCGQVFTAKDRRVSAAQKQLYREINRLDIPVDNGRQKDFICDYLRANLSLGRTDTENMLGYPLGGMFPLAAAGGG